MGIYLGYDLDGDGSKDMWVGTSTYRGGSVLTPEQQKGCLIGLLFIALFFCPVVIGYFIFNPITTNLMYGWTNENHVFFIWTGGLSISILFILSFVCLESSPYLNRFFPWSIPVGAVLFYAILGFGCGWTYSILLFLFVFSFQFGLLKAFSKRKSTSKTIPKDPNKTLVFAILIILLFVFIGILASEKTHLYSDLIKAKESKSKNEDIQILTLQTIKKDELILDIKAKEDETKKNAEMESIAEFKRVIERNREITKNAEMARLKLEQEDKNKLIELERLKQEEIAKLKRVTDLGNGIKIDLSLIPSGYAKKGPDDSFGLNTSSLSIEKPFYISKYETTQEQWEIIMGNNPSRTKNPKLPVTNVSWLDCQTFIKKLNLKTDGDYRLPTEDEWEYACRAGTTTAYSFGQSISKENANYDGSSIKTVGNYKPNAFGLYDMHGNALEWCEDWYAEKSNNFSNAKGPEPETARVLRGGSFDYNPSFAKSSGRSFYSPTSRSNLVGFRLVRTK
jgi:hypothetical protein